MPESLEAAHLAGVQEACKAGRDALLDGKGSVDAVADALVTMEEDETFDAGKGSFLNSAGAVELDAGMMSGCTSEFASIGAVTRLRNPILVCRDMLLTSPNKFLVADGAHRYAQERGFVLIDNSELCIPRERERYEKRFGAVESYFSPSDTVGAVACDGSGCLTVGNTTGGTPGKPPGRVGDSPIVGCGIYAGKSGGIAATGHGEPIIKSVLAKRIYDLIEAYRDIDRAAIQGISDLGSFGWGGIIAMDCEGNTAARHNTTKMPYASWNERDGRIKSAIGNPSSRVHTV
jgi:beta-aspartyl-peptidase (threonine type)